MYRISLLYYGNYFNNILAGTAFVATNLDDIFVLMIFFISKDFNNTSVVLGQYIGILALVGVSALSILFKFILPTYYISLLGIIPILLGARKLWKLRIDSIEVQEESNSMSFNTDKYSKLSHFKTLQVSAVTFANGGDNLGVYIPLFLSMGMLEMGLTVIIFMIMTGVWCILGYILVNNRIVGDKLESYGHVVLPMLLILIGIGILFGGSNIFSL